MYTIYRDPRDNGIVTVWPLATLQRRLPARDMWAVWTHREDAAAWASTLNHGEMERCLRQHPEVRREYELCLRFGNIRPTNILDVNGTPGTWITFVRAYRRPLLMPLRSAKVKG